MKPNRDINLVDFRADNEIKRDELGRLFFSRMWLKNWAGEWGVKLDHRPM